MPVMSARRAVTAPMIGASVVEDTGVAPRLDEAARPQERERRDVKDDADDCSREAVRDELSHAEGSERDRADNERYSSEALHREREHSRRDECHQRSDDDE